MFFIRRRISKIASLEILLEIVEVIRHASGSGNPFSLLQGLALSIVKGSI